MQSHIQAPPIKWCFALTVVSSLTNYIAPFKSGAIGLKGIHLKLKYDVAFTKFIGVFALMSVIGVVTNAFIGIANTVISLSMNQYFLTFFFVAALVPLLVLIVSSRFNGFNFSGFNRASVWIRNIAEGMRCTNESLIIKQVLLQIMQVIVSSVIMFLLFKGVAVEADMSVCLLLAVLANLGLIIAITPANLGVKEIFFMGASALFEIEPELVLSALIVDRAIQLVLLISMSIYFRRYFLA